MSIYNPKSMKAEEFINDAEIRETIAYAQANKTMLSLSTPCLRKPAPSKTAAASPAQA